MTALRPYLELVRLPAVFTAPADVLAGVALATAFGARADLLDVLLLVLASASVYCAGMAANDVCDAGVDARERPGRPIPSGRVPLRSAWTLVVTLELAGLSLAALVSDLSVGAVAATIACTWLYNASLKASVVGPFAMGACRYFNAMIGVSIMGALPTAWPVYVVPLGTLLFVASLTFLSRHEVDGATPAAVRPPIVGLFSFAALPVVWPLVEVLPVTWAAALVLLPLAWLFGPLRAAARAPSAGSVRGGVMAGIYAVALINAVLAAQAGGLWQAAVIAGLLVPGRIFGRWFYAT